MLAYLLVALALSGGATWTVLDGPVAGSRRRNHLLGGVLLAAAAAVWIGGLIAVLAGALRP
ncbi:hypothetical protein [Catenuloplanes atrovinosus]|uniref:Uncharacterized protein n=1 Tax=Catenuloplanes atrovinosus TaxID=137266 RepID=A0AAE4C798_9ACTN|nr:hypothetical protein [Catenuloplanes atrovinosus]MDR7274316.1 hypothetical protein [Catenuloplanes atrovinosus]